MKQKITFSVALLLCSALGWGQSLSIRSGTLVHLTLVSNASSKSADGSAIAARLARSVQENGATVLPEGTVFEGHVQAVRARRLQKSGSLRLVFDRLRLPGGALLPAHLSVVSVELRGAQVDPEGTVRQHRSKKRLAFEIGGVALAAKLSDDAAELATSSVTKGMARLFGLGGAAAFVLLQRGTDVKIPAGTGVDAAFTRELSEAVDGDAPVPAPSLAGSQQHP